MPIPDQEPFNSFVITRQAASGLAGADLLPLVQASGLTRKLSLSALLSFFSPNFSPAGSQVNYTPTLVTSSSYAIAAADTFIAVNFAGAVALTLPVTALGQRVYIADCGGNAGAFPITITPQGGSTIDGVTPKYLAFAWQSIGLQFVPAFNLWKLI